MKKFNYSKIYYKVTNQLENHNGLQYHDGLVVDPIPFNSDPKQSCVPGGIYFTDIHHIGEFFRYGDWVRPLKVPKREKIILDPDGKKWRTHRVNMQTRMPKLEILKLMPKKIKGSLDLRGCDLKGITLPQSVGGYLDLRGCDLKGITLPQSVGGYLDLRGCDLKGITLPQSVGGSLYLRGCDLKGITLPQSVGGSLYLRGCDLKGITLPQSVGGSLYLRGCDLKGITLPQSVGGSLDLRGCENIPKEWFQKYNVIH